MGRRSRQRAGAPQRERVRMPTPAPPPPPREQSTAPPPAAPLATAARRSRRDSAPRPPWGSFPLVELCALSAIVLGGWGILRGGRGGGVLLAAAALLGSVAGLEVAIREHVGGYRSHTLVLSGACAVAVLAVAFYAGASRPAMVGIAGGALVAGLAGFRALFKRRTGGVGMRVR
jgi:hypothetical protein